MQPTVKISALPKQSSPATTDKMPLVHGNETDYVLLSDLITLLFANIPSGTIPGITGSYVISGLVWTADSAGVNRNASMTAGSIYINSRTISISAVTARTYTASKDTYIDILDNLDGTGTLVYTEVANNAASPALASNSIRIGIIITGATTIATSASVNQGQEDRLLPITSSTPYAVTDSLGNLICCRDPDHRLLGLRQITTAVTSTSGTGSQLTGLIMPIIIPTLRKIKLNLYSVSVSNSLASGNFGVQIWEGTVGSGTQKTSAKVSNDVGGGSSANMSVPVLDEVVYTPSSTNITFNVGGFTSAGTMTAAASSINPMFIKAELL
jgi:hypothetical protein